MDEISTRELAVRIEAVSWFVERLVAELEMTGLIDGPRFSQQVRKTEWLDHPDAYRQAIGTCLKHMADRLDQARSARSSM